MVPWWDIIPEHNTQLDLNEVLQSDKHVIMFPSINTSKNKIEVNISMYYPLNVVRKLRVIIEVGSQKIDFYCTAIQIILSLNRAIPR